MKIDRLVGIITVLLQRNKVTAAELAERFEVSTRTIIRDIDDLNRAGIPIVTEQGRGGGISIMDEYKIDRTLFSSADMQAVLTGLMSLDSVSGTNRYRTLMQKISPNNYEASADNHIIINLSGWDKGSVSDKIETIKLAVEHGEKISFKYFSPVGESIRIIEPYHIIFQWSAWYVWGYCIQRKDYRMFKLTRITDLKCTGEKCESRTVPQYICRDAWNTSEEIKALVRFDSEVKWRVIDEFGAESLRYDKNGDIVFECTQSDLRSFFCHILSFGDKAEILEPEEYRREFSELLKKVQNKYLI